MEIEWFYGINKYMQKEVFIVNANNLFDEMKKKQIIEDILRKQKSFKFKLIKWFKKIKIMKNKFETNVRPKYNIGDIVQHSANPGEFGSTKMIILSVCVVKWAMEPDNISYDTSFMEHGQAHRYRFTEVELVAYKKKEK